MASKRTELDEELDTEGRNALEPDVIEAKILHILRIYPMVSPTMLQGGLGAYMKPKHWRPVYNRLVEEGKVIEEQKSMKTHAGRYNSYAVIHLPNVFITFGDESDAG